LVNLLLGGPIIAGATLSRFFALHVFVIPGLLIAFVAVHVLLVLKLGINEWPMPGRVVRRSTYLQEYHELTHGPQGIPFVPAAVWKDLFFSGFILLSIAACAAILGPFGPGGPPDPTIIQTAPRPDFFFLWLYAVLSLLPPSMETPALLIGPRSCCWCCWRFRSPPVKERRIGGGGRLRCSPFSSWRSLWGPSQHLSIHAPWSPAMDAWSGEPIPAQYLEGRTALERQGALVFQVKQCHNCHSLNDRGGQRGPALDEVAVRLTRDQLIRQVIQGGGNMPAYGNNLSPAETTVLVAFLETLHPPGQAPARDASRAVALGGSADESSSQRRRSHTCRTAVHVNHAQVPATLSLALVAWVYARGWFRIRRNRLVDASLGSSLPSWLDCCRCGSVSVLRSRPISTSSSRSTWCSTVLLMAVAPPLLLLGAPGLPLLHGLPLRSARRPFQQALHSLHTRSLRRVLA
jgi:ubiquinol-cytochrome c reductase cytochrome b subunit